MKKIISTLVFISFSLVINLSYASNNDVGSCGEVYNTLKQGYTKCFGKARYTQGSERRVSASGLDDANTVFNTVFGKKILLETPIMNEEHFELFGESREQYLKGGDLIKWTEDAVKRVLDAFDKTGSDVARLKTGCVSGDKKSLSGDNNFQYILLFKWQDFVTGEVYTQALVERVSYESEISRSMGDETFVFGSVWRGYNYKKPASTIANIPEISCRVPLRHGGYIVDCNRAHMLVGNNVAAFSIHDGDALNDEAKLLVAKMKKFLDGEPVPVCDKRDGVMGILPDGTGVDIVKARDQDADTGVCAEGAETLRENAKLKRSIKELEGENKEMKKTLEIKDKEIEKYNSMFDSMIENINNLRQNTQSLSRNFLQNTRGLAGNFFKGIWASFSR